MHCINNANKIQTIKNEMRTCSKMIANKHKIMKNQIATLSINY